MLPHLLVLFAIAAVTVQEPGRSTLRPDPPIVCEACDEWNAPREPFKVWGNTYFVGVGGLSAVLVTSPDGHVLIDGGLPQSAALIDANIRALGFRTEDVRYLLHSHAHFDHVGGLAALQRLSGATVVSSAAGARALEAGAPTPDDPQHALDGTFPAVTQVRVVADQETIAIGGVVLTMHHTPGHTPGGTSWTWRACEAERCVDIVYGDSLTAVSAPEFLYTAPGQGGDRVAQFRASIDKVAALPCDIVIAAHPGFTDIDGKLARRRAGLTPDPFVDPGGCRAYASDARSRLERRVAEERKGR